MENIYPCKPKFYYIKVECKGGFVTRTCFRDEFNRFRETGHLAILRAINGRGRKIIKSL